MGDKTTAFVKGGLGCLGAFIVIGAVVGGSVHLDAGGACCLFAIGGIIGLIVLAIYKSGRRSAGGE